MTTTSVVQSKISPHLRKAPTPRLKPRTFLLVRAISISFACSLSLSFCSLSTSLGSSRARNRVRGRFFPAEDEPKKAPTTDDDSAKKVVILTADNFDEHTQSG